MAFWRHKFEGEDEKPGWAMKDKMEKEPGDRKGNSLSSDFDFDFEYGSKL